MTATENKYGTPTIGCYLDHANYNNNELSVEIIKQAIHFGYQPDETDTALLACYEQQWLNDDGLEMLNEASEDAITWLNSQETRSYLYWSNEGEANAFGLWPNVDGAREDVGFVSHSPDNHTEECDPDDSEYPAADYRGEWLHVNDHGNCTLYVRGDDGQDKEVWSCV